MMTTEPTRSTRPRLAHALAVLGALVGWFALALQFVLLEGLLDAPAFALWRFLGYFTILTNILAAIVLTQDALWRRSAPRLELLAATSIAMVGLVYSLLLRAIWSPEGWRKIADMLLHDVAPLLFVVYFLLRPRAPLRLVDALVALIFPLLYVVYAMVRGAFEGWYAYWFLDPHNLTPYRFTLSVVLLTAAFLAMSLLLTLLSNRLNPR